MAKFLPFFGRSSCTCIEYYTIIYMALVDVQMMLDAALFQTIINAPQDSELSFDIYQCILIPVHCLQATLQFFFGFDLYKAVIKRSFRGARNWRVIFLCLLAIETSVFVAYICLASFFSVFTYVTAASIAFKLYLVWPLRMFLDECHEVCVPLAHAVGDDENVMSSQQAGPSGYSQIAKH